MPQPIDADVLPGHVQGGAERAAVIIERAADHRRAPVLPVDRSLAVAIGGVEPHTPLTAGAETPGHIHAAAEAALRLIAGGDAIEILLPCPFQAQIHAAAKACAARCRTVQKGARPVQNLNALQQFGRDQLPRRDAI